MANWEFTDEEITAFFEKLDTLNLIDKERALLKAILLAASGRPADPNFETSNFKEEFASAFSQNHAESIVATYSGEEVSSIAAHVKAGPAFIVRS